ncbi:UNVERIFIED_CONTAM: hypothetical protein RMT77_013330 [Armadillidium vulgare]|uniref:Ragulator complex protein LAMTOR1 n=1 Tax=Armadillidium nasatum TaxID=96803 RepID=A0A5N5T4H0_9CRUS|nr:Ragulator complex protein LAMTOR1 [Armadillidium nasatum]
MGCCCSTEDSSSLQDEPNAHTRLLQDPVSNSYQTGLNNSANEYGNSYGNSVAQKTDDQSAQYKVLQQIANKVIDVGALDCQTLEEHEYAERARVYAQSINKIHIPQSILRKKKPFLLMDVSNAERILSAPPISQADYNLMTAATENLSSAYHTIQVTHTKDLVVSLGKG